MPKVIAYLRNNCYDGINPIRYSAADEGMKTYVTEGAISDYQREGYLFLGEFLTVDELEELRAAVGECLRHMDKQKVAGDEAIEVKEGDTYYDRVFLQRVNLWKINETIRRLFLNPDLGEMLTKLAGVDGIRVWHDQTLQKQPWANPTAWHLDNPYWSFHSPDALSIWIALDDVTLQNGCVHYLPGSHKIARYENVDIGQEMAALFDYYPDFKKIEAVHLEMKAGMAAVHNGLTAHAAGANMTPYWRRALTCAYMPDGATFNGIQNILSDRQVSELRIGGILNDVQQNPLIWAKKFKQSD